jgi:hypothetical protein
MRFIIAKVNSAHGAFTQLVLKYEFGAGILFDKFDLSDNVLKLFG